MCTCVYGWGSPLLEFLVTVVTACWHVMVSKICPKLHDVVLGVLFQRSKLVFVKNTYF